MTINQRTVREGLVGLLLLVGLGVAVGLFLWVNNFRTSNDTYTFMVVFEDANGLSAGVPVRLRGVDIGQVTKVTPSIEKVTIEAVVDRPGVILPRQARYTVGQRGLIGETFLEILPGSGARTVNVSTRDFKKQCAQDHNLNSVVVCPGELLQGETPTRVQDLITSLNTFAKDINGGVLSDLKTTVRNIGTAARQFGTTATEIQTTSREIGTTARAFTKVAGAANQTLGNISSASTSVGKAANDITGVVQDNRTRLATTLEDLSHIAHDLSALTPTLADPHFSKNLASLSESAAESASNIRRLSAGLSDPATIDSLRETLDAARSTFRNAEKISADVDEITGDPKFRANLKKLVEGLGQLVSSAEQQVPTVRQASHQQ